MYQRFEKLCERKGVKPYRVGKETKIATSTLSEWKAGRYTPKADKIERIAEFLGVTPDYLHGKTNTIYCAECYQTYDPLNEYQDEEHTKFHDKFLKAVEKYGQLLPYGEASDLRDQAVSSFRNPGKTMAERIDAFEAYLKYDYMLHVYANSLHYEYGFDEYCRLEAESLRPDALVSVPLCNSIKEKYHVATIQGDNIDSFLSPRDDRELVEREKRHIVAYRKLDPEYQDKVDDYTQTLLSAQEMLKAAHKRTDITADSEAELHDQKEMENF